MRRREVAVACDGNRVEASRGPSKVLRFDPGRRDFLRAALGIAAGALLRRPARATAEVARVQVAVVGAGLAGLVTGRELLRGGADSVLVLEARERVGGRTVNLPIGDGHVVEGGGEWVGPTQTRILALADALGIRTFPSWYEGDHLYDVRGEIVRGADPPLGFRGAFDYLWTRFHLERAAARVPLDAPWTAPDAARLDALTVADWLADTAWTGGTRDLFELVLRSTLDGSCDRVSLLWFLFYVRSAGGLEPLIGMRGGAQDSRIEGGSQRLSLLLAEALAPRVRLACPVRRIEDASHGPVRIESDGGVIEAERAVVAMMPADTARIEFVPPLPSLRQRLVRGFTRAVRHRGFKVGVVYDTPFWREAGQSGLLLADHGVVSFAFDNSPPDGSLGVLGAFLAQGTEPGPTARRRVVTETLARYFGERARAPRAYVEKDWTTDPWSVGCVTPLQPGVLSESGPALRAPVGRIHWAGSDTSEIWNGYMEGAVRSGERVAREVLAAL